MRRKMKTYRYQLHTHTSPTSRCGAMTPEELANALYENGLAGAVLTNHFFHGNSGIDRSIGWSAFVREYEKDYIACKAAAEKYDLDIIFGIEEHIGKGREILLYGITPELLYNHPELISGEIEAWLKVAKEAGALVIQAHPFRDRAYITAQYPLDLSLIDGIEVYNYGNNSYCNDKAEEFAKEHPKMILTSGADTHSAGTVFHGGIECTERIKDGKALVNVLKSGDYKLIKE